MSTRVKVASSVLLVTHVAAVGGGYLVGRRYAPTPPVRTIIVHDGYLRVTTSEVLATTVESLREENKLLVFSYKGSATVRATSQWLWVFRGQQQLIVPAVVNYYLDLSALSVGRDVIYDRAANVVHVRLHALLLGDIAFQPEAATTINGGSLTYSEAEVEALRKLNYATARRAMEAQAEQIGLVNAARRSAIDDVKSYFKIPLRIAGMPDVAVDVTFQ